MEDKIKKLLDSDNIEDILVGWELLKTKNIPVESEEWYPYLNIFFLSPHSPMTDVGKVHCKMIEELYENWSSNINWKKWAAQTTYVKARL